MAGLGKNATATNTDNTARELGFGDDTPATPAAESDAADRTVQVPDAKANFNASARPTSIRDYIPFVGPSAEQKAFDDAKAAKEQAERDERNEQMKKDIEARRHQLEEMQKAKNEGHSINNHAQPAAAGSQAAPAATQQFKLGSH